LLLEDEINFLSSINHALYFVSSQSPNKILSELELSVVVIKHLFVYILRIRIFDLILASPIPHQSPSSSPPRTIFISRYNLSIHGRTAIITHYFKWTSCISNTYTIYHFQYPNYRYPTFSIFAFWLEQHWIPSLAKLIKQVKFSYFF